MLTLLFSEAMVASGNPATTSTCLHKDTGAGFASLSGRRWRNETSGCRP